MQGNPKFWKHEIFGKHLIDPYRGHLVTMVRQPEQRIASDYYDAFFDFRGDVSYPGTRYRRKDALGNPVPHNISFEQPLGPFEAVRKAWKRGKNM